MLKTKTRAPRKSLSVRLKRDWQLYLLILPVLAYFFVFNYLPLYGIQIAFRNYRFVDGITRSPWVGLEHFRTFFNSFFFTRLLWNTFILNLYHLLWSFPFPIILAIMINRLGNHRFKRFAQTTVYIPNFISIMVMAGMIYIFCAPAFGLFNVMIRGMGGSTVHFLSDPGWFRTVFIASGIWQGAGWGSILYLAALTGIDQEMYEAATVDGATILQKIRYIELPSLIPIATMVLILSCGQLFSSHTEKALLLQTPGNIPTSDIIGLYVFRVGIGQGRFSFTAAIGLFANVVNFAIILIANYSAKKLSGTSMF